jgi:hypothetical protein
MTEFDEPSPGSKEALAKGCTCPVMDNHHGAGFTYDNATCFYLDDDCPLHGGDVDENTQ